VPWCKSQVKQQFCGAIQIAPRNFIAMLSIEVIARKGAMPRSIPSLQFQGC
jgi:hypothetical protein